MIKLAYGLDVSSLQKKIDWKKVKSQSLSFTMIRIGFRGYSNGKISLDKYFLYNIKEAYKNNFDIGLYFYATSINEEEAKEEAQFIISTLQNNGLINYVNLPIVYDFEGYKESKYRTYGITQEQRVKNYNAFKSIIQANGYNTMLYGSRANIGITYRLDEIPDYIWCAKYSGGYTEIVDDDTQFPKLSKQEYTDRIAIWQYTSIGHIDGISTRVDLDALYIDIGKEHTIMRNRILSKATSYIGLSENPKNSNNVVFNTDYYGHSVSGNCYSWCCTFVWDIFRMCEASKYFYNGGKTASCTNLLNYYKKYHPDWVTKNIDKAQAGDLVFYQFDTDAYADHIGIYEMKLSDSTFSAIEGNTSPSEKGSQDNGGCVARKTRKLTQVMSFVHIEFNDDVKTDTYSQDDFIREVCAITGTSNANDAFKKTVTINRKYSRVTKKWTYKNQKHELVKPLQRMFNAIGYDCGEVDGIAGTKFFSAVDNYESVVLKMTEPDSEITVKGSIWRNFLLYNI